MTVFALACGRKAADEPPIREAIAILYVSAPEARVHAKPDEKSPVITTYSSGEAVSVLSRKGTWTEVRAGADNSGWVQATELSDSQTASSGGGSPTPRFLNPPSPVYRQGAHGEVVFEADVNTDGAVFNVRTVKNTTGSEELERLNREEFVRAKFYPLVVNGTRQPFLYTHRITY